MKNCYATETLKDFSLLLMFKISQKMIITKAKKISEKKIQNSSKWFRSKIHEQKMIDQKNVLDIWFDFLSLKAMLNLKEHFDYLVLNIWSSHIIICSWYQQLVARWYANLNRENNDNHKCL